MAKDIRTFLLVWAIVVAAAIFGISQLTNAASESGYIAPVRTDAAPFAASGAIADEVLAATSRPAEPSAPSNASRQRRPAAQPVAPSSTTRPRAAARAASAPERPAVTTPYPRTFTTVRITRDLPITARPGGGAILGTLAATSRYLGAPTTAWVLERSDDGRHGKVYVPWEQGQRTGWIPLQGAATHTTDVHVRVSISRHELSLVKNGRVRWTAPVATGADVSPTPRGRYWVTDLVPIPGGGPFGHFAFGISGRQNNLPPGWTGGDQMAIHGTNDPGSIGTNASAGCVRASAEVLERLRKDVGIGTPVILGR